MYTEFGRQASETMARMRKERQSMVQDAMTCAAKINDLLSSVRMLKSVVTEATKDSGLGAANCQSAINHVIKNCRNALTELNSLDISGITSCNATTVSGPVYSFPHSGTTGEQTIEVNGGLFFSAVSFKMHAEELRKNKNVLTRVYEQVAADNNAQDIQLSAARYESLCQRLDQMAATMESYSALLNQIYSLYRTEQIKAIKRAASIPT